MIDEKRNATEKEISDLKRLFSRSGFTNGYFKGKKGPSMFGIRTEKDKEKGNKERKKKKRAFVFHVWI